MTVTYFSDRISLVYNLQNSLNSLIEIHFNLKYHFLLVKSEAKSYNFLRKGDLN